MFKRILIANRGEIAVRIARTCRAMGVETVAVHVASERTAAHVLACDAAIEVPGYLDGPALVRIAGEASCEAVHPGYGFLSESAEFARTVRAAGLAFVGPSAQAMETMGSKTAARAAMLAAGVPVVPGTEAASPERLVGPASALGYPVLVKAVAGGGGKGMVRVDRPPDLVPAARACAEQAQAAFGDGAVYVEKLIERPRHVEVQVFGDAHGHVVALGERECSIQRRHQKIVEETPSPGVDADLRARLCETAVAAARAVAYEGAGTVEFLLAPDRSFHFLEMNTRLQVEHPVTEWVTGLDLVALQLAVASGIPLPAEALDAKLRGHAIECRVYAEDPASGYLPQSGPLLLVREPSGPGVRVDSALAEGDVVSIDFDPLLAKLSAYGTTRAEAIARLREALARFVVLGVRTNIDHLQAVVGHPAFEAGDLSTAFLEEHLPAWTPAPPSAAALAAVALPAGRTARATTAASEGGVEAGDPWRTLGGFTLSGGVRARSGQAGA